MLWEILNKHPPFILLKTLGRDNWIYFNNLCHGKTWRVGNASRNETNEILTVYLVKRVAFYTGDQDDL